MLRFFRLNDPYRLLGVLLMMIIMALPILVIAPPVTLPELKSIVIGEALNEGKEMYIKLIDNTPWLAAQFHRWIELIFSRSLTARHLVALFILFFQASFFSIILIRNKAYNESNYFPALVFGVLCFFSFDVLSASNELFGSTCLLFALNSLFKEIEFKAQRDDTILSIGFYLGLASLFVFSYAVFLVGSIVILFTYARLDFRKAMLLLFGF
ncbi:MAG TPA: hypothetical protein DGG95_07325, partial [Cytophagales bacterium]|nr:hypothetical protein [Cytophagales bacterium]